MSGGTVAVIGAHASDFVWRAGGTIAVMTERSRRVVVLSLTYGERGESGPRPSNAVPIPEAKRRAQHDAGEAAAALGAEIRFLDFSDQPLVMSSDRALALVDHLRDLAPSLVITHLSTDASNPDHAVAGSAVDLAVHLSTVGGLITNTPVLSPRPEVLYFEPEHPEASAFNPHVYVDITPVMERKIGAMRALSAQANLIETHVLRARYRGLLASRLSGDPSVVYAEPFHRKAGIVVREP